jgi:uncharacterized membrane protein
MVNIRMKLKQRWKVLAILAGVWLLFMFPIPFLPLMGLPFDPTSVNILMMITAIVTIPFTLLAIFMNDGRRSNSSDERPASSNGDTT